MELRVDSRRAKLIRMDDQDRVSQASSVATISYFPIMQESDGKVQTFGKRCQAAKRDPNCPVVIRGWLNKKDSSGLKLWKRRWFVLSNYCLYYYKDSREESVLGSIPLPSYKILFCSPRECKNRKFTFKVVHQGMRSYFFSADTQEDMLGWVRALSQSAMMEPDAALNRRCSSYQDFTQIGGSTESMDFSKSPGDEQSPPQKHKHVSRALSESGHLSGGRMGRSQSEHRGRRSGHQRNRSPSNRMPSPVELNRRRTAGASAGEHCLPDEEAPPLGELLGGNSLSLRGQLGSQPHTPMGRLDLHPRDDPVIMQQSLYHPPASPNLEYKSAPTTPVTERWQSLSKPAPIYGTVQHGSSGRRPLSKSLSTGADLLPPLPPSSRAAHSCHIPPQQHQHHHCSLVSAAACVLPPAMASKPDLRELPPIVPLECEADAVLTRLCGCDKLLQSLSGELGQLQMDKDSVQCALDVSRLQVEEWKHQGPRAHEEALTQKALLQEELVTIRARVCDVTLEMERVWSQYERMESELSVIRSHLQHICNFGMPQEQSQAQRELWMMEDILDGLRLNRDHICYLLGIPGHHTFQSAAPHPGSPAAPAERLRATLPMDLKQEPPARPPLPLELQENPDSLGWTESPYEGIYSHAIDPPSNRGNSQPDLLNMKSQADASESQFAAKKIPADTSSQSTKRMKIKMSEEEQVERLKKNQERLSSKKKPPLPVQGAQSQLSEAKEEPPFPLRVTRVVTAVLPSSLVARRVSVEDPPDELNTPLPEQISLEMHKLSEQSKKLLDKPPRQLLLEAPDPNRSLDEMQLEQTAQNSSKQQHNTRSRTESLPDRSRKENGEASNTQAQELTGSGRRTSKIRTEDESSTSRSLNMDPNPSLSPEQRDAKLRRVERIRERVMRSAVRESSPTDSQLSTAAPGREFYQILPDKSKVQRVKTGHKKVKNDGGDLDFKEVWLTESTSQGDIEQQGLEKNTDHKKQNSGSTRVSKTKAIQRTGPNHISSMSVYQEEGGKGFRTCSEIEDQDPEENDDDSVGNDLRSSDLRAKWFLSTSQWQGFTPLHVPTLETLPDEESADSELQQILLDEMTNSSEMSSAVSESLEKMKENHSLFYKIACDITMSDSDITKSDTQIPSKADEEKGVLDAEPKEAATNPVGTDSSYHSPSHENTPEIFDKEKNLGVEIQNSPAIKNKKNLALLRETPQTSKEGFEERCELQIIEETTGPGVVLTTNTQKINCGETTEGQVEVERSKEQNVDQEGSEDLKKYTSSNEVTNENKRERKSKPSISLSNAAHDGGGVKRSASFGRPRVTVLKTSL